MCCISKVGKRGEFGVRHASLGGGVHLILANPPWRQLQESAEKIPGDKKHMEGMLSRSYYVVQFNTAHKLPSRVYRGQMRSPPKVGIRYRSAWTPALMTYPAS